MKQSDDSLLTLHSHIILFHLRNLKNKELRIDALNALQKNAYENLIITMNI